MPIKLNLSIHNTDSFMNDGQPEMLDQRFKMIIRRTKKSPYFLSLLWYLLNYLEIPELAIKIRESPLPLDHSNFNESLNECIDNNGQQV